MKLNIGPGISGTGDKKIDRYPFPGITDVLDVAIEPLPYDDNTFNQVEASQVLEHIPTQIYWREDGKWHHRFPRVELMREIHRVLKPRGVLVASVPHIDRERDVMRWAQDPTHVDVPWILESFDYFCNGWGGGQCKHEAHFSSGINFGFERIKAEYNDDMSVLTVWLRK